MKAIICLVLVAALAGCAVAQNATSPSPAVAAASPTPAVAAASPTPAVAAASPAPAVLPSPDVLPSPAVASPAIAAVASPAPVVEAVTPEPAPVAANTTATEPVATTPVAEAPAANATANATSSNGTIAGQNNITNSQVQAYYSSPLFAIQQTPDLAELAKLSQRSAVAALLSDKKLVATIFAPNNDAVNAAVKFIEDATGANRSDLVKQGVVEQLLSYHVTKGAPLLLSKLKNEQVLTMLDGNKTTISIDGASGARRMLLQDGPSFFINSNSNQQFKIVKGNIQGGKSMLHIIDGVLVPKPLLDAYNIPIDGLPGVVPGKVAAADTAGATSTSREVTAAPATKSSASRAVAAMLAVPALLAALMF